MAPSFGDHQYVGLPYVGGRTIILMSRPLLNIANTFWAEIPPENKDRFHIQGPFFVFSKTISPRDENQEIRD